MSPLLCRSPQTTPTRSRLVARAAC
jgi:hypothetical protein